jgi:outer membrane lipoprotein-sorting protein
MDRKPRNTMIAGLLAVLALAILSPPVAGAEEAAAIVEGALDQMRGAASKGTAEMTIHRPEWERTMTMRIWTLGRSDSLVRITGPAKDAGNGTLKKGKDMWMFNPKINRLIKLPPSMMSQGWMGSDFSNNDLAKTDSLVEDYEHAVESTAVVDDKKVYTIVSRPKPGAAVVWGMLRLEIREDHVLLSETFYDESDEPVKKMVNTDIRRFGERLLPATWTISKSDAKDEYTVFRYKDLQFLAVLSERLFTQSNLRDPGR